jgi:lipid-binding SYLF domain-containing protein
MKTLHAVGLIAVVTLISAVAATAADPGRLDSEVRNTVERFQQTSPRIQRLFNEAYGYAVFPAVGKAAIGIGGAEGRGEVFERGTPVGTARLIQGSVGPQLGAESYSEVVFFESEKALNEFKDGKTAVSAALSAVIGNDGAAAEAKYQHGVIVCAMEKSGLMIEASVGGQHFKFTPMSTATSPVTPPESSQPTPPASTPSTAPPSSMEPPQTPSTPQSPTPPPS